MPRSPSKDCICLASSDRDIDMTSAPQTYTPHQLLARSEKGALAKEYVGKKLNELRTPALVIDRSVFASNCARMHEKAREWGAGFRAHLKTHKVDAVDEIIRLV